MNPAIQFDIEGSIGFIRFNRPDVLNALNVEMAQQLAEVCRKVAADPAVRVVVLSGNGRAFMAGGDLQAMRAQPTEAVNSLIPPVHEAVRLLAEMPKPVIASVHGAAAGAGMSIALVADMALAAANIRFNFAYSAIGTSCDGGMSWSLPRLVGMRKAMEIAMVGDVLDAAEALRLGLVNRVVEPDRLEAETLAMAQRLAQREPHALAHLKRLIRVSSLQTLSAQLNDEFAAFVDCARRPEFVAAIDSFFARR
ncbi:MAG TPA: enoyl-CoA hydratase-related protein [Noviherbaspirillum sp.]|uniref:enoyl-CoA hydratase/isomerase family protein n=1 Tax=Noviherbaspirillum sp. TaxID=1926288 RepID=UPI002B47BC2F|nr:enoyl-CoA hydratase-related protein [Noviherbaspirillum sp.]HJV84574.1 enoyl-CoA hydratase-related protein [Noviherbaspirillum sp.]